MSQIRHPARADGVSTDVLIRLFGLPLLSSTPKHAVEVLLGREKCRAAFVNAHCINVAYNNHAYRNALESADLLLPDGAGIDLAARWQGTPLAANLNGTDLCPMLLAEAARRGLSVFLLGGQAGVAEGAANALSRTLPELRIAGTLDGFVQADPGMAIPAINDSGADILLVAMGVPLQDLWLAQHADALRPRLVMGVGALFDFLAGRVRRAPLWIRRIRMEWVWRLAMEPRRMFGRYVIGNIVFLWRARCAARPEKPGQGT